MTIDAFDALMAILAAGCAALVAFGFHSKHRLDQLAAQQTARPAPAAGLGLGAFAAPSVAMQEAAVARPAAKRKKTSAPRPRSGAKRPR